MTPNIPLDGRLDRAEKQKSNAVDDRKGQRYYFDIYSDVNISCVNEATIRSFLCSYGNPRFIAIVDRYLNDRLAR